MRVTRYERARRSGGGSSRGLRTAVQAPLLGQARVTCRLATDGVPRRERNSCRGWVVPRNERARHSGGERSSRRSAAGRAPLAGRTRPTPWLAPEGVLQGSLLSGAVVRPRGSAGGSFFP